MQQPLFPLHVENKWSTPGELRPLAEEREFLAEGEEYSIRRLKQLLRDDETQIFNETIEAVNKIRYQKGRLLLVEGEFVSLSEFIASHLDIGDGYCS
jgi:hypothetical protein